MAWVFFLIVLVLTAIQFKLSHRWVFYAGGEPTEGADDAK
jgi:hypothetical protein